MRIMVIMMMKFNIVLSVDNNTIGDELCGSSEEETTDEEYHDTDIIDYEKPLTRSKKTNITLKNKATNALHITEHIEPIELNKNNNAPPIKKSSKETISKKLEPDDPNNSDTEFITKMMQAKVKGDEAFSDYCNMLVEEKEKEILKRKQEKEESEKKVKKEENKQNYVENAWLLKG